jgi:hypothetical protein
VIGSPAKLHELLAEVARTAPVAGNYHGSYLTFRSRSGAIFAVQVTSLRQPGIQHLIYFG